MDNYDYDIAVQKQQNGEYSLVEFLLNSSAETAEDFKSFCRQNGLPMDETVAFDFMQKEDAEMETAMALDIF
ncbi:MAG: hypothetical protein LIP09_09760 [Bacteroidales bacterium]|nr:hypothetical protein [Bacteroidales bacterium]